MTNDKPALYSVLLSRKFWMSAIGLILILVMSWNQHPFPTDSVVTAIMGVVGAYVAATAWEDGKRHEADATMASAPTTTVTTPSGNVTVSTSDTAAPAIVIPPAPPQTRAALK